TELAAVLVDLGRLDEAAEAYRKAVALQPDLVAAHNDLGLTLFRLGRPAGAEAAFRKVLTLRPAHPTAPHSLAVALAEHGRHGEAATAFGEAAGRRPGAADIHLGFGKVLMCGGRLADAQRALQKAHDLATGQPLAATAARELREVARLRDLDGKLASFLKGEAEPAGAGERLEVARLCFCKQVKRAAGRLFREAFKEPSAWGRDRPGGAES